MKKTSNHRVLVHKSKNPNHMGEVFYMIHEVYYEDGKPVSFRNNHYTFAEWTPEELKTTLEVMILCLKKPILHVATFPKEYQSGYTTVYPKYVQGA